MSREWTIKSGESEAVVSSLGGTVTQFRVADQDIFFPQQEVMGAKVRGGAHWCSPWFGAAPARGGERKHGFLRDQEARSCLFQTSQTVGLEFGPVVEDGRYPWLLKQHAWSRIDETGALEMGLIVERDAHDEVPLPAPINPGLHPYFACDEAISVGVISGQGEWWLPCACGQSTPIFLDGRCVEINDLSPKLAVTMSLEGAFKDAPTPVAVLWSDASKYICVEPILGHREEFDTPRGMSLQPGQNIHLIVRFQVKLL